MSDEFTEEDQFIAQVASNVVNAVDDLASVVHSEDAGRIINELNRLQIVHERLDLILQDLQEAKDHYESQAEYWATQTGD